MKRWMFAKGIAAAIVLSAVSLEAQVFTPTYQSPRIVNEMGGYLSDGPGDLALEGIWRGGPLGLRVGYADVLDGVLSISGELRSPLAAGGVPLGLAFTAAAQGLIGDRSAVGIQGGLTAGYTFSPDGLMITPYIHPRIAGVNGFGRNDSFELELLADIGVDVEFYNNMLLRFGFSLDDVGADWGVGLSLRR